MHWYRRFKKRHRVVHLLLISTAIVLFWRGVWVLLDTYLLPDQALMSSLVSIGAAFIILYLDGFHLKELE